MLEYIEKRIEDAFDAFIICPCTFGPRNIWSL
jgi:hypothetical protein